MFALDRIFGLVLSDTREGTGGLDKQYWCRYRNVTSPICLLLVTPWYMSVKRKMWKAKQSTEYTLVARMREERENVRSTGRKFEQAKSVDEKQWRWSWNGDYFVPYEIYICYARTHARLHMNMHAHTTYKECRIVEVDILHIIYFIRNLDTAVSWSSSEALNWLVG